MNNYFYFPIKIARFWPSSIEHTQYLLHTHTERHTDARTWTHTSTANTQQLWIFFCCTFSSYIIIYILHCVHSYLCFAYAACVHLCIWMSSQPATFRSAALHTCIMHLRAGVHIRHFATECVHTLCVSVCKHVELAWACWLKEHKSVCTSPEHHHYL